MIIDFGAFEQGYYSLGWIITWAGRVEAEEGQILWATAIINEHNIAAAFDNKNIVSAFDNKNIVSTFDIKNLVSALDDRIIKAKARSR